MRMGLNVLFTWQGAVIAATVVSFPIMYRTSIGAFEQVDKNLLHAARTLGMSEVKLFLRCCCLCHGRAWRRRRFLPLQGLWGIWRDDYACGKYSGAHTDNVRCNLYSNAERQQSACIPLGGDYYGAFLYHNLFDELLDKPSKHAAKGQRKERLLMALYVDIEKRCGDFKLRVKFETKKEMFAILGASGCGKSLTLKCIAGIEKPDTGVIKLDDTVLFDSSKRINIPTRKRGIGYLFQDYALFPNMTVFQNILCGAGDKKRRGNI